MASKVSKKTWIIVAILIIVVGVTIGTTLSCDSSDPSSFTLPIITWNETALSAFEGTPVVLNFWSIGCTWCRYQLPFLEEVAQQAEGEIKIISMNIVDSAARIQEFFGDYEPTMIIAMDQNGEAFVDYCVAYNNTNRAVPFMLFVDSESVIQHTKLGAFQSVTEVWNTLHDVFGITIPETS
jgi:thiol-disulfide isomerase/thioredoxin